MDPKIPFQNKLQEKYVGVKRKADGTFDYSEAAVFQGINAKKDIEKKVEQKPEKLFRAFTVHPEELSIELFTQTLIPQNINSEDETKVFDGNEKGVYMSTNELMVEDFYSNGRGWANPYLKVPQYNTKSRGFVDTIQLPNCGIVLEIDTTDLRIRKPEIAKYLETEHNNGMEGNEWIADEIDSNHYHVKKLILSRYAHDRNRFVVEVKDNTPEALQSAIDIIKGEFYKRKRDAQEFKNFLVTLSEEDRKKPNNLIKQKFQKYKIDNI